MLDIASTGSYLDAMSQYQAGSTSSFCWEKSLEGKALKKQVGLYLVHRGRTMSDYILSLFRRDEKNRLKVLKGKKL